MLVELPMERGSKGERKKGHRAVAVFILIFFFNSNMAAKNHAVILPDADKEVFFHSLFLSFSSVFDLI